MDNKKFSIFIIFVILLTGFSTVFAVEDQNLDSSYDLENAFQESYDNQINTEIDSSDEIVGYDDSDVIVDDEQGIVDGFDYEDVSLDEDEINTAIEFQYNAMGLAIYQLNNDSFNYFLDVLEKYETNKYDDLLNVLKIHENNDMDLIYDEVRKLSYDNLLELGDVLMNVPGIDNPKDNISINISGPVFNDNFDSEINPLDTEVVNKIKNNNIYGISSISQQKGVNRYNSLSKTFVLSNRHHQITHLSLYNFYHYLLEKYLSGQISFKELKDSLELAGFGTSNLILNEDGSITFLGETSEIPKVLKEDTTNSTSNETGI